MANESSLLSGRRLLVVDDEPFSLLFVVRILKQLGCANILQATNGAEALQQLKEAGDSPTLAIVDFNMPEINGLEVLRRIRTGAAGVARYTKTLMLTGSSDFALVGAAMALDVDAFVVKPVSLATLTSRLEKILAEGNDIKPAADYEAVDITEIGKRLLSRKPVGTAKPSSLPSPAAPQGIRVRLDDVPVGAILADHVRSPSGVLLLGAATVLSERLIRRLKELREATKLEYVTIFPTTGRKSGSQG